MNASILVTYASQAGSTRGIAEAVAAQLRERGLPVDCLPVRAVASLDPYRAVVVGSAIHGGKWLPDGLTFLRRFSGSLRSKIVFAFYVGMAPTMASMRGQDLSNLFEPVRRVTRPAGERGFAGAVDPARLPLFPDRLVIKGIISSGLWQAGDHRDWDAVHAWGREIGAKLSGMAG